MYSELNLDSNLRKIRKEAMSTKEFLKLTGISRTRLYEIEVGNSYIYQDEIEKIAKILKTTPEEVSKGLLIYSKNTHIPFQKKRNVATINNSQDNKDIKTDKLHPKKQAIINFIRDYPHQYPPTIREIAVGVGLKSSSTVHSHLNVLVEQGYIERRSNCPRCITLTDKYI